MVSSHIGEVVAIFVAAMLGEYMAVLTLQCFINDNAVYNSAKYVLWTVGVWVSQWVQPHARTAHACK